MAEKSEAAEVSSPPPVDKIEELAAAQKRKSSDAATAAAVANGAAKLESDAAVESEPDKTTDIKKESTEGKAKTYDSSRQNKYEKKSRGGNKYEYDDLPETDDPAEIRAQVEFYFSNANLRTDEHLFYEMKGSQNIPVSIKHLHTFKRMRRFQPYSAIVEALRDSEQLVVVDDGAYPGPGNETVARKEAVHVPQKYHRDGTPYKDDDLPVYEEFKRMRLHNRNALEASIYVNNFGSVDKAGQIAIEEFFKPYGAVMVRRRVHEEDGSWKGSVFVEFDSEDSAKQFLVLDPKPKFNGNALIVESKRGYSERKCAEKGITPKWERDDGGRDHQRRDRSGQGSHYRGRGERGRGGRGRGGQGRGYRDRDHRPRRARSGSRDSDDSRDWNGRRDKFQKSRDFKGGRRNERAPSHDKDGNRLDDYGRPLDDNGVPKIGDSRKEKRKADDEPESAAPKKTKIEVKEDE